MKVILEKVCDKLINTIPDYYKNFDLKSFGIGIDLFPYQEEALKKILVCLYLHSENKLFYNYNIHGFNDEEDIDLKIYDTDKNFNFLSDYYKTEKHVTRTQEWIEFSQFGNRASFWMATGSGKTLVMIKLIEILHKLIKNNLLKTNDIMLLAPKDEILEQIKYHIDIFNQLGGLQIYLRDLRDFEKVKNESYDLFKENSITVFYYRADNISDENKEKLLSYKTVLNNGNWYVILDEAHKGEKSCSVRQQYYTILSQNGFLFNFSATFTDVLDITTTVYNFNLKKFIESGYGKHIKVSNEEYKNFNKKNDNELTDEEKQIMVLKSLIVYTALKKEKNVIDDICNKKEYSTNKQFLYHNPLLVTIANSVNTIEADLKIYFKELINIASNETDIAIAKQDILNDFIQNKHYQFNTTEISDDFINVIESVTYKEILKCVFNSNSPGVIEVSRIINNSRELAFKLTSSDKHFGLLVASDAIAWQENILEGYVYSSTPLTQSYFKDINDKESDINILLGSRIFAEGWDSNRPNVINFINIGINEEAQKFVLQAMGRGVRIEPVKNIRKRLNEIGLNNEIERIFNYQDYLDLLKHSKPIESLFIFATNKEVLKNIINGLDVNSQVDEWQNITGIEKNKIDKELLFPLFIESDVYNTHKYKIGNNDYETLLKYVDDTGDKLLIFQNNIKVNTIKKVKDINNFDTNNRESNKNPIDLLYTIEKHFNYKLPEFSNLSLVTDEIRHFQHIQVNDIHIDELVKLEKTIKSAIVSHYNSEEELELAFKNGKISFDQLKKELLILESKNSTDGKIEFVSGDRRKRVTINNKFIKEHYYKPILIAEQNYQSYFKHVIKEQSEIDFLGNLYNYSKQENSKLKNYEWWYFSKLDESIDDIYIPYYNSELQMISRFLPDFIFWMKKGNEYFIKFIDPKGRLLGHITTLDKVSGFELFYNKYGNSLKHNDMKVNFDLILYNSSVELAELKNYFKYDFNLIF